jgi:tRNA modification GTPase
MKYLIENRSSEFCFLIELELDFAEEDVEFADRTALSGLLDKIE